MKQLIKIEPGNRIMLQGHAGDTMSKKVIITSFEEKPFEITGITSTIDEKIKYELKNIREEEEYSLEIKTRSGIKEAFRGKVMLKTSSQKKPDIDIFVMYEVK